LKWGDHPPHKPEEGHMNSRHTDTNLITEIRNGDSDAFLELVERYTQKVHNLAFRISRNEEDTEEIVQDVFVTVHTKLDRFEGKSAFSSWLYRITANTAFMKLRKKKQTPAVSLEDLVEGNPETLFASEETPKLQGLHHELRQALEEALEILPYEYRAIFVLRDVDGLSNQEVSEILGITVPAVKSRLHRSRLMLRKKLKRLHTDYQSEETIHYGSGHLHHRWAA
jgi:RNA polymerase sigma-70 factor, ECF subfamily